MKKNFSLTYYMIIFFFKVLKYDPMRNRWFQCAGLKQGRIEHAAVAIGGKILVTGLFNLYDTV